MKTKSQKGIKKTGLFFGSYNPIHHGHLIIASYMLEFTDLEEVWFVVSPQNPLKEKKNLLADYHRLALVNLAIEDHYQFRSSNIEFSMPKPSYTIDTLTWLNEKYENLDIPSGEYHTLSGYIVMTAGNIPEQGDEIELDGLLFKIEKVGETKIETIRVVIPHDEQDLES